MISMVNCLAAAASIAVASGLPPHPRLILTEQRASDISAFVRNDTIANTFFRYSQAQANWVLSHNPPGVSNGIPNARVVLQNMYSLALTSAATGNTSYSQAAAAWALNSALSGNGTWDTGNTAQLNTGEMLHMAGFGLDWFYGVYNDSARSALTGAIVNTGLAKVYAAFTADPPPSYAVAFVNTSSNWNTVILGGTIMACLAVQGEPGVPSWVDDLLALAIANLKTYSGTGWGTDGAWPEGPNYSGYTARYLAPTIYALRSATGSDSGLWTASNVSSSPRFLLGSLTPNNELYYWWDARSVPEAITQYLAFAALAGDGAAAYGVKQRAMDVAWYILPNDTAVDSWNAPLALLYYTAIGSADEYHAMPRAQYWSDVETVAYRTSWADPQATFIGLKGFRVHDGVWAHSHLDAGALVFQSQGQWFAQDLGCDSYSAPGYFSKDRFKLYRTGTIGHNTVSFGGQNQMCQPEQTYTCNCSVAPITLYQDVAPPSGMPSAAPPFPVTLYSIVDLTNSYSYNGYGLASARRGFIIGGSDDTNPSLITVDEISLVPGRNTSGPVPDVWWSLHTVANVSVSGDGLTAVLSTWNTTLPVTVTVLQGQGGSACPGAAFQVVPIDLQPPMEPTPGVSRLTLTAPAVTCTRLVVAMGTAPPPQLDVRPLDQWQAQGPVNQ